MKTLAFFATILAAAVALAQAPIAQGVVCSSASGNQLVGAAFGPTVNDGTCNYWDMAGNSQHGVLITVDFSSQVICAMGYGSVVYDGANCPHGATAIKSLAQCKDAHICF